MSQFNSTLQVEILKDGVFRVLTPFKYQSDILKVEITIPQGFYTDFASVPRIPVVYELFGGRSDYEAVVHDYLYCQDSVPLVTEDIANKVFRESMIVRGKSSFVYECMYTGVCIGGSKFYHQRSVADDPYMLKLTRMRLERFGC